MTPEPANGSHDTPAREAASITLGSISHAGIRRQQNEDSFCALMPPNTPRWVDALLAVADGLGGHQAGEVASCMAIRGVLNRLTDDFYHKIQGPDSLLAYIAHQVNSEVYQASTRPETQGMGTTLTAAMLIGRTLSIAHVGDTRAYLMRKGKLSQLTQDHYLLNGTSEDSNSSHQAKETPVRAILSRALGVYPTVDVDRILTEVAELDLVLLCSDGLHSQVTDGDISFILAAKAPQEACQTLMELANSRGGNDNITVVIARIDAIQTVGKEEEQERSKSRKSQAKGYGKKRTHRLLSLPLRVIEGLLPFVSKKK